MNERHSPSNTVNAYLRDVNQFLTYMDNHFELKSPTEATENVLKSWFAEMLESGLNVASVKRKHSSLNTYFRFLKMQGVTQYNPVEHVQTPQKPERLVGFIEEEDLSALFEKVEFGSDRQGQQEYLILETLYGTGIRLSELIGLKIGDVHQDAIKVLGKGNKERFVPLHPVLSQTMANHLNTRINEDNASMDDPLFITRKGKPLYPMYVYRLVKKTLSLVSTVSKKSPHQLRHSFATHLLNKGGDINAIKKLLGHESLAATQVYTHNSIDRLKDIYKKAHPKGD